MTCIVGLATGGTVWLGADSAASGDDVSVRYKTPKLFRRGKLLFGVVSSFRLRDIIHHDVVLSRRRQGMSDEGYLVQLLVEDIRRAVVEADFDMDEEGEDADCGAVLIGYHGRLWTLDWDFHLGETLDGYASIGSGAPYALGALKTTQAMELTSPARVRMALEAGAHFSQTVRPPFKVLSIR